MITKFTIFGERCSGTNYLEKLIILNFDIDMTSEYGWKHFLGFKELKNSDDILFICIVREISAWMNSFFRTPHHIPLYLNKYLNRRKPVQIDIFLNKEFWSAHNIGRYNGGGSEIMEDRNIYTGQRYKNIFELRHTKLRYLIEDVPKKVKHYIFIKYEDLLFNFENTMNKIREKGLYIRSVTKFPENIKKETRPYRRAIPDTLILKNPRLNVYYEKILGYM